MNHFKVIVDVMTPINMVEPIPQGQVQFSKITVDFSTEWDGLSRIAQFKQWGKVYNQPMEGSFCFIPTELELGKFEFSIRGGKPGQAQVASTNAVTLEIVPGVVQGGTPSVPPKPDLYNQLVQQVKQYSDEAQKSAESANQSATSSSKSEESAATSATSASNSATEAKKSAEAAKKSAENIDSTVTSELEKAKNSGLFDGDGFSATDDGDGNVVVTGYKDTLFPKMLEGKEYQTPEYWEGTPIYTMIQPFGKIVSDKTLNRIHGIKGLDKVVRCMGNTSLGESLPWGNKFFGVGGDSWEYILVCADPTNIRVTTINLDPSKQREVTVQIWYTKKEVTP